MLFENKSMMFYFACISFTSSTILRLQHSLFLLLYLIVNQHFFFLLSNFLFSSIRLASKVFSDISSSDSLAIYNARKQLLSSQTTVHSSDFQLLAELETKKLGSQLKEVADEIDKYFKLQSHLHPNQIFKNHYEGSIVLTRVFSFVGEAIASGQQRVNAGESIQAIAALQDISHFYYQVHPPMTELVDPLTKNLAISFVIDPLSLAGQRAMSLISLFRDNLRFSFDVLLVPRAELAEFPLKNFYRFVVDPQPMTHYSDELTAVNASSSVKSTAKIAAKFTHLPRNPTLTVRVDTPESWNVQRASAWQDMDNLRCITPECGDPFSLLPVTAPKDLTSVGFVLKNLLVSGQCLQINEGSNEEAYRNMPPNGLQLLLTSVSLAINTSSPSIPVILPHDEIRNLSSAINTLDISDTLQSDTLVMQNLGYYQLQANPGLYGLRLAEGRARDLYTISQAEVFGGKFVIVNSFVDEIRRLVVVKRKGLEHISLLDDNEIDLSSAASLSSTEGNSRSSQGQQKSFWESLTSTLFTNPTATTTTSTSLTKASSQALEKVLTDDDYIHVFSLATGHMYERLLRIMMLSVSRQASMPVKFWLFENYLSPSFKKIASAMAATYEFQVAYVTYKWPTWLRQQTEQQRIIWGYKILFLDVLFPLNIKKVIYVDADQVVRADIKELWDMDLQGKPYGYTPFCTSRKETLGFQFWRSGYWKEHLQGLPYHISALYVVDLQVFRRYAIGDRLRAIYDQLSRDPNSLANLDQDLPNFAQHQVPIFSLPQEWLWCETWCSDGSKSKVKNDSNIFFLILLLHLV